MGLLVGEEGPRFIDALRMREPTCSAHPKMLGHAMSHHVTSHHVTSRHFKLSTATTAATSAAAAAAAITAATHTAITHLFAQPFTRTLMLLLSTRHQLHLQLRYLGLDDVM